MDEEDEVKTPKQLAKEKQAEEWAAFMVRLAPAKAVVKSILDSVWFNVITGFLTTFALFGDDVRIMAFTGEGSADLAFSIINLFTMFWFVLEIIGNSFAKNDYFNGFYFWLDIVSTASMIFDIKWFDPGAENGAGIARTGRVSKAAKGARVVRIARLLRLVRIVKFFKMKKNMEGEEEEDDDDEDDEIAQRQPSKVAKKLTELTTRKIIILLLAMVAVFPFFDEPYAQVGQDTVGQYRALGIENMDYLKPDIPTWMDGAGYDGQVGSQYCFTYMDLFCMNLRTFVSRMGKIRYMRVNDQNYDLYLKSIYFHEQGKGYFKGSNSQYGSSEVPEKGRGKMESDKRPFGKKNKACLIEPCNHDMRWNPRRDLVSKLDKLNDLYGWRISDNGKDLAYAGYPITNPRTMVYFDTSEMAKFEAMLNMLRMIAVMIVLMTAVIVFTQDATELVVGPIERMMTLVQRLAENPLGDLSRKKKTDIDPSDETYLLEQTLTKISGLLQVGFGVAGAEVISKSMSTEAGAGMNYMLPGKRITAVFGFAIIEDFTVTCGALEEEVCTYINTIASVVHEGAHSFHGAPNKNIGCAFLMVWKICDGVLPGIRDLRDTEPPPNTPEFRQWRTAQRAAITFPSRAKGEVVRNVPPLEMVESALASFLKVQVDLHTANKATGSLDKFNKHPKIVAEFGDDQHVHMGFGLHIGWAIEGTIGSKFKIDASYLSPNVNTSARLEAATHMYQCPLLMSGFFIDEMSPASRSFCRMVDVVSVKGSNVPLELWTFDVSFFPENSLQPTFGDDMGQLPVDFANDLYYRELQKGIDPLFMQKFNDAIQEYVAGDWKQAKLHLVESLKRYPEDGPSKTLMRVLAKGSFTAPPDWKGFRALTSKT
ncbi:adenylate and guanylate cyclase [Aureococcus anophagefferens]|uniref:Adenylate and guanylate cyclase n=1 Tax=Aureococcus anophagefferens TaxID=44056 RepID=A0ABR1GAN8_AURAN